MKNDAEEGAWDVFGSEEEDDNSSHSTNDVRKDSSAVPLLLQQLTQIWMLQNAGVRLSERIVGLYGEATMWTTALAEREIQPQQIDHATPKPFHQPSYDAMILCLAPNQSSDDIYSFLKDFRRIVRMVVPGGIIILPLNIREAIIQSSKEDWMFSELTTLQNNNNDPTDSSGWELVQRRFCTIQWKTCRWLPSNYDLEAEYERARKATVALSMREHNQRKLTAQSIQRAIKALQQYGYCIISGGLIHPEQSNLYGQAALSDLQQVADTLRQEKGLQLFESGVISEEAAVYREISQREHFRVDIRHGPTMEKLRGTSGNVSRTMTALENETNDFLRGNADLLEIIRRVMNPVNENLSPGNFGRYNFEGRGPDGSFQDVRVGPVGAIVTWPGATDQALHADTPHLFEHMAALPAHYINVFTPGSMIVSEDDAHKVGQTAFLHETHKLDVTAKYEGNSRDSSFGTSEMWRKHLVRPQLNMGDVVLFDCRILHFGLPNESEHNTFRPLLYTNVTMHWFHDPKNWDNEKRIFSSYES
ncbi:hypothetical protein FisN_24Lh127 [Fistulifera solaris]|uniref:Phytanoyl-CoA dioxygenase n=1 Tax=Fistulifera solaris TaxID=1519565 RepID=A0A1Z5K9C7_FISSO|nr:hypothetical protein FisN_24Lh127 [Fistulifera solaris]|eukprot:GAX22844.1 hypothetical protein FisN_24Lh127 [Fistulifera solaris]